MRKPRTGFTMAALGLGAMTLLGSAAAVSADAETRPTTPVAEQNTDTDGNIRVHEQGVVDSRVLNLPLDDLGRLQTAGQVTLDQQAQQTLADVLAELQELQYDADGKLLVSGPEAAAAPAPVLEQLGTGGSGIAVPATHEHVVGSAEDVPFLATNLMVSSTADTWVGLRSQGRDVAMYAVEAGEMLHVELTHPLLMNVAFFQCRDASGAVPCTLRYSISGYDR